MTQQDLFGNHKPRPPLYVYCARCRAEHRVINAGPWQCFYCRTKHTGGAQ